MYKFENRFGGGLDKDTTAKQAQNTKLRGGYNIMLLEDGDFGAVATTKGTKLKATLLSSPTNLNVLASVEVTDGIVYFTYDDNNGSQIRKFLYSGIVEVICENQALSFPPKGTIDAFFYVDRNKDYIVFTDYVNPMRRIAVQLQTRVDTMSLRALAPIDCIKYKEVRTTGSLDAGSYQFMFRYWNSKTCDYTAWSNITFAVPIKPDEFGGKIGTPTDKSIVLEIPTSEGVRDFDQVQLLVIRNTTAITPTSGYLLNPVDLSSEYVYSSNDIGTLTDLNDVLIDDLPIKTVKTLTTNENRLFLGNVLLQDYKADIKFTNAETIQRTVDYQKIEDCVRYKSAMRGETYVYGVYLYDENGIGVVCPLDFSKNKSDDIWIPDYDVVSVISQATGGSDSQVRVGKTYEVGDKVRILGQIVTVLYFANSTILVDKALPLGANRRLDLLFGQKGNQGSSYAWKFVDRKSAQGTLFDQNGNIKALGLKLTGLTNFPTWAVGFEIVRLERKRDIIYQFPHVPTMIVQGVPTPEMREEDYFGDLDYLYPKLHRMGNARNIVASPSPINSARTIALYKTQNATEGTGEVPRLIFAQPPEYMYSVDGTSFDLRDVEGYRLDIIDAVALKYDGKVTDAEQVTFSGGSDLIARANDFAAASVFSALDRRQYYYNREGYVIENGLRARGLKIEDSLGFGSGIGSNNILIDWEVPLSIGHGKQILTRKVIGDELFEALDLYGNVNELALQQFTSPTINANGAYMFNATVRTQRGIIMGLKEPLEDFTRIMFQSRVDSNHNYFPLLNWSLNTDVYAESYASMQRTGINAYPVLDNAVVASSEYIGGAYVLNIKKGLGDFRYGATKEDVIGRWCRTGICGTIKNTADKFDLEVFGGDMYITPHSIKVHDGSPRLAQYTPVPDSTDYDENSSTKVGARESAVEILELYLESEVNAYFERVVGIYPAVDTSKLGDYAGDRSYYYHPQYSKENCDKPLVTKQDFCDENSDLTSTVCWSDIKVRDAVNSALNIVDGWRTFRTNNRWSLEQQYGQINKLVSVEGRDVHIFQERKVGFQPIGVDELRTADGALIATGTGTVLGSGDYYIDREIGTQHIRSVKVRDGVIYFADNNRRVVCAMRSRGADYRIISWEGMNSDFRTKLGTVFSEHELEGFIDPTYERYWLNESVYNMKGRFWETEITFGLPHINNNYWLHEGKIYQSYVGQANFIYDRTFTSKFSFILNPAVSQNKVFEVLQINASEQPLFVQVQIFDMNEHLPIQDTGLLSVSKARDFQYFVNTLRDFEGHGRSRLRGVYALVTIRFDKGIINNTVMKFRYANGGR